jgi:hypothetical protein
MTIPTRHSTRDLSPAHAFSRPGTSRAQTFEGPSRLAARDMSPAPSTRLARVPTDSSLIMANRAQLRPVRRPAADMFADQYEDENGEREVKNGHGSVRGRRDESPPSPATSHGSLPSRAASYTMGEERSGGGIGAATGTGKKGPPPPPPSRAKKPPPPPPPMKRSVLG